jgi:hypothetical protein
MRSIAAGHKVAKTTALIAAAANLGIKAHAHMLRHACGYKLANDSSRLTWGIAIFKIRRGTPR